jgi:hypothetical protein
VAETESLNFRIVRVFFFCMAALVLVDGFRGSSTADPGPVGSILCAAAFLYRVFIKPTVAIMVTISGLIFVALVLAGNHGVAHSNLWAFSLFVSMLLFLYWEHLFKGRDA